MMKFREFIQNNLLILDGGMGTMLQSAGLPAGTLPEVWNLSHPDVIRDVHRQYFLAGSHVVSTNTFGANPLKFQPEELENIIRAAVRNAREAADGIPHETFVALDVGPLGRLLKPYGDLDFEDAVSAFAATVKIGAEAGVDLIVIETMNDSYETKAALLAAKETCDLPVLVSNAYGEDGKLMTGADPAAMIAMLEGLGADLVGVNCSFGPKTLLPVIGQYLANASVPVSFKPNAGLPRREGERTVYDVSPDEFAKDVVQAVRDGVRAVGGCCGTTPEYIRAVADAVKTIKPRPVTPKKRTVASSYTHAVTFGNDPVVIGERLNPTGKERLKTALRERNYDYILGEGIRQSEDGAQILDVNVGLPGIDEGEMLCDVVTRLQGVVDLPLQIDTADPAAMERAVRRYNGKPVLNSVNGKEESLCAILPIAKKYGGVVVALTLDENGIPATAEGRVAIAEKIIARAAEYGIGKNDILFDPLTLTVSAEPNAARVTLGALAEIRGRLGCNTVLGVSNISFGLPVRDTVNSIFFATALDRGLSAAIMNPSSLPMQKALHAFRVLNGLDANCAAYLDFCAKLPATEEKTRPSVSAAPAEKTGAASGLQEAIVKGLRDRAGTLTGELLKTREPFSLIREEIIPALDTVGRGFEEKRVYLPQLLMSAEAASAAFERIKSAFPNPTGGKCRFVLATVQGDIHDIGKNIVRLLLENYGFAVTDLGRDVAPETVVRAVRDLHAPLVGLSALMTTTLPAMEETVRLLRRETPWCRIVVGGAVLTKEYAGEIGADRYASDAMETVRYAEEINGEI